MRSRCTPVSTLIARMEKISMPVQVLRVEQQFCHRERAIKCVHFCHMAGGGKDTAAETLL